MFDVRDIQTSSCVFLTWSQESLMAYLHFRTSFPPLILQQSTFGIYLPQELALIMYPVSQ